MKKKILYLKYACKRLLEKLAHEKLKIPRCMAEKKVCGYPIHTMGDVNRLLSEELLSEKPFSVLRPGNGEFALVAEWEEHILFGTDRYKNQSMAEDLKNDVDAIRRFSEGMKRDFSECDFFAVFSNAFWEQYLIETYSQPKDIFFMTQLYCMEPSITWLQALKGKKVLFISPFTETMESQYRIIDKVWGGYDVLPQLRPVFLKSVWITNSEDDDFETWFEGLEYLKTEMQKLDFDVLLAGCGSFSTFLVAEAKRMGKQAIQYGGALQ